ncbi:O-antigen ligase family protein [Actinokineospora bangkokensis]|uniref:O-antigen ligase family protein n=1 Tax=Actinokineospora bangkokensis TaxID=1193682 RepID=UPI001177AF70|nr:O-antigen ligase family protein [Actinokineospora bangkokensis]
MTAVVAGGGSGAGAGVGRPAPVRGGAVAVAAGVGAWLFVPVVGRISLTEVAAVLLAPAAVLALLRVRRIGPAVLLTGSAWIGGLVLGHLLHPAPATTLAKAVASAGVFVLTVGLVCGILRAGSDGERGPRDLLIAGFAVGQAVGIVLTPPDYAALDPWKFGVGQSVTLLVLIAVSRWAHRYDRVAVPAALSLLAALHLVLGARSLSLFAIVIALAAVLTPRVPWRRGWPRLVAVAVAAGLAGVLLGQLYTQLATDGDLGAAEQQKVSFQTGDFGIAVGGRKDVVFLVSGVLQSPITGWGPSARVPSEVKSEAVLWLREHGYPVYGYDLLTYVLPDSLYLHSVLLGAWVTGGVLGFLAWLLVFCVVLRGLARAVRDRALAEAYMLLVAAWHVLFSPLGDSTRGHIAVAVALALTATVGRAHQQREEHPGGDGGHDRVPDDPGDGTIRWPEQGPDEDGGEPEGHHPGQDRAHRALAPAGLQPDHQHLREHHHGGDRDVAPHRRDGGLE